MFLLELYYFDINILEERNTFIIIIIINKLINWYVKTNIFLFCVNKNTYTFCIHWFKIFVGKGGSILTIYLFSFIC